MTKGYGDTSARAQRQVSDLAFTTVKLGQTTFPELAAAIGKVVPLSKELTISQEQLFAVFATGTGVTGNAARVSTQYQGVLQALLAPTDATTELLEEMGVASGKVLIKQRGLLGAIETLVGAAEKSGRPLQDYISSIEGQTLALALAGEQSEVFRGKLRAMQNSAGAMEEAFREQTEGINKLGFEWDRMKAKLSVIAQKIGDELAPSVLDLANELEPLLSGVVDLVEWFNKAPAPVKKTTIAVVGMAAVVGPALIAIGAAATGIGATVTALAGLAGVVGTLAALAPAALLSSVGVAAGALGLAPVAGVLALAGGLGVLIGIKIRPWVNELLGLNEALDLIADHPDEELVKVYVGDEDQFRGAIDQYNALRKQLKLTGAEWIVQADHTEDNARRLVVLQERVSKMVKARTKEAVATRESAAASEEAAAAAAKANQRTSEQAGAIADLVAELNEERDALSLTAREQLEKALTTNRATDAERAEALAIFDKNEALRQGKREEEKAGQAKKEKLSAIEAIIEATKREVAGLALSRGALAEQRLEELGATEATRARVRAMYEEIDALTAAKKMREQAAEVVRESLSPQEQYRRETAKLVELLQQGHLTTAQYEAALAKLGERYRGDLDTMSVFADQAARNIHDAFSDFFFAPFDDGLDGMVKGFTDAIRRMVAELLASKLLEWVGQLFGNAGGFLGKIGGAISGTVAKKADGGLLRGPGTSTSDSIPMLGSVGEFVIKAAAVKKYGVGLFQALNAMLLPRFAAGGLVPAAAMAAPAGAIHAGATIVETNYHIDARGADAGVEQRVRRAIRESEDRAVNRATRTVAEKRMRGGNFGRAL